MAGVKDDCCNTRCRGRAANRLYVALCFALFARRRFEVAARVLNDRGRLRAAE